MPGGAAILKDESPKLPVIKKPKLDSNPFLNRDGTKKEKPAPKPVSNTARPNSGVSSNPAKNFSETNGSVNAA